MKVNSVSMPSKPVDLVPKGILCQALREPELARFYRQLWGAEVRHGDQFVEMALQYFEPDIVYPRLEALAACEAEIVERSVELALDALVHDVGDTHAARFTQRLQPCRFQVGCHHNETKADIKVHNS